MRRRFKICRVWFFWRVSILESPSFKESLFEAISDYCSNGDRDIGDLFKKTLIEKERKRANITVV